VDTGFLIYQFCIFNYSIISVDFLELFVSLIMKYQDIPRRVAVEMGRSSLQMSQYVSIHFESSQICIRLKRFAEEGYPFNIIESCQRCFAVFQRSPICCFTLHQLLLTQLSHSSLSAITHFLVITRVAAAPGQDSLAFCQ
jgi:hypothetical protein